MIGDNNVLMSKLPKTVMRVSPEYKYMGESRYFSSSEGSGGGGQYQRGNKVVTFVKLNPDNSEVERVLLISIQRNKAGWEFVGASKEGCGKSELGGQGYRYCTEFIGTPSFIDKFITSNGYISPDYWFRKQYARRAGGGRVFVSIFYFEAATTETQSREDLQRFHDHCAQAFEILS
jgi:hypothetical protein